MAEKIAAEDDDIKLLRASASSLSDLESLLPRVLRKRKHGSDGPRQRVRIADMEEVFALVEPLQEDPQLLDSHLKIFIPPLVAAYLISLRTTSRPKSKKGYVPVSHAICQILNLFCKVRGEKVIKGFLNNEPRYLELILSEFEGGKNYAKPDDEPLPRWVVPWTERYVLLLWLSHLLLAPFPLASMSALESSRETSTALGIDLPAEIPGVTLRVLTMCVEGLKSASKERGAAANLLVRLCVRPDMQKLGLLDALIKWSLSFFSRVSENTSDIHQCLGVIQFVSMLVTSTTNEEISGSLPAIYGACRSVMEQPTLAFVKASAVARKLIIKTFRNIVVHCLQADGTSNGLDTTTVLEEVIEYLLEAVGDGDTLVRYAASKALSVITIKLEPGMAGDVVEAILCSLKENVYWQGPNRNLSGVNPLAWHGLTLTLSHLLYRRALSTSQLPELFNALLLALTFEQRSATGGSIGTNVRDAACFGIWALARRYTTKELLAVDVSSVRASEHQKTLSIIQVLAIELLVVACLDPAGNIRRGSSAALQELIGRHPDTVEQGIPLVQIVDFHAVGLRDRAMCDVLIKASKLHSLYWSALFENLLEWRGTGSLDSNSRLFAARAVGLLSMDQASTVFREMADQICTKLSALKSREVEERQGLVASLACLVDRGNSSKQIDTTSTADREECTDLTYLWRLFEKVLKLDDNSFTSPALRPDLTASSFCTLLGALAMMTTDLIGYAQITHPPIRELVRLFNLSLGRHADAILEAIPRTARTIIRLLGTISPIDEKELVDGWLAKLENEASHDGQRWSGIAIALGAAYAAGAETCEVEMPTATQKRIIEVLAFRCTSAVAIEPRTVALHAIRVLLEGHANSSSFTSMSPDIRDHVAEALHIALNDYTVTERGDVGSLVRLEALSTTGAAWDTDLLKGSSYEDRLRADVVRLSLEKLDKVRLRAAKVLEHNSQEHLGKWADGLVDGVSSYTYFANALTLLHKNPPGTVVEAICLGFVTSAGMASESVVQNARAALLDAADSWPSDRIEDPGTEFTLLDFASGLLNLLKTNLDSERTLLPLLEVVAFLFDMQVLQRLTSTSFNFRALLSYTQKAHFKSTHMQKLQLALDIYRGLGTVRSTRVDTVAKVTSMLLHPFPKIRIAAAETLWLLTRQDGLKRQDWSLPSKNLKPVVETVKATLAIAND